ncbi:hypothetical protein GCM10027047_02400 [Rhodococcus aerolatus]
MRTSDFRTTTSGTSRLRAAAGATAVAAVSVAGLVLGSGSASASTFVPGTTTVSNEQLANSCDAVSPSGFCSIASGGATTGSVPDANAILGDESLALQATGGGKSAAFSQQFAGRQLSDITDLEYQTYLDTFAATEFQAPALNIAVNPMKADDTYTTLVWEPYYTTAPANPVVLDQWQKWTPSEGTEGKGGWWASDSVTSTGSDNKYGFGTYTATFDEVKAAIPNAVVLQVGVNVGSGNLGLSGLVDGLTVNDTTYNFEVAQPPAAGPADLTVKVTAGPAASGSPTDVQVVITNNGANPSGPTTATALAPGYAIADPGTGTLNDNGSVTYGVPYLAPGASATFSLTTEAVTGFRFGLAGAIVLPAPGQPDPNIFNNLSVVPLITR